MTTNTIKNRKIDLLTLLAFLVVARICCPALSNVPFMSMAFVFIYGVAFIFLYIISTGRIRKNELILMMAALGYPLYILVRNYMSGIGLFARDSFNAYIIVFLTVILMWAKDQNQRKRALLLKLIFLTCIFNYVYSIRVLYFDPGASRAAASTSAVWKASPYDPLVAIGGFDAVYGGISVILVLLYMRRMFKEKEIKNRISILILILAIVFIVMASYATAVVLLVFALMLFSGSKNKGWLVVLLLLLVAMIVFHDKFGDIIMLAANKISFSEILSEKLYEFGQMFRTFELAGTYEGDKGRFTRLFWSIDTFKQYPLFGGVGRSGSKIGGHSEILDLLGRFGLVGLLLVAIYFCVLYKYIVRLLESDHMKRCLSVVMVVFVIAAVLNPSLYSLQMVPIILMIPLAPDYVESLEQKNLHRR